MVCELGSFRFRDVKMGNRLIWRTSLNFNLSHIQPFHMTGNMRLEFAQAITPCKLQGSVYNAGQW